MENNFDSMLNVSAVPQDDRKAAFIAESRNNRNRCYELAEQITAEVATDGRRFQEYLDIQAKFEQCPADSGAEAGRKQTGRLWVLERSGRVCKKGRATESGADLREGQRV